MPKVRTCSEPLVWICHFCGHSFHEKEWDSAGQKCPACDKVAGSWRCSLCQAPLSQPSLGKSHSCHSLGRYGLLNDLSLTRWLKGRLTKLAFVVVLILCLGSFLIFLSLRRNNNVETLPAGHPHSPLVAVSTNVQNDQPTVEEHACNEGFRNGLLYDAEGVVNLRAEPNPNAPITRRVESGTPVTFREYESGDQQSEWKETYLQDSSSDAPPQPFYVHQTRVFMEACNKDPDPPTNIRAGAGYDFAVIGQIGKEVPVYIQSGDHDEWITVLAGDKKSGFILGFTRRGLVQDIVE